MTTITLENMKAMFEQLGITVANSVTQSLTKNQQDDIRRNRRADRGGGRTMLDDRGFEGLEKFQGSEEEWAGWSWTVMVAVQPRNEEYAEVLKAMVADPKVTTMRQAVAKVVRDKDDMCDGADEELKQVEEDMMKDLGKVDC